ncbi:mycoredoxin [Nocardiopsis sp. Huas11]|nr:mycoredoxin [Nocardiopsis sp. Huas11]
MTTTARQDDVSEMTTTATERFTMYTTPWCGYCKRLKSQLAREGITVSEVNIEEDPESAEYVMKVNGGNQTVPTVVFSDGAAMTNPSLAQVKKKLAELA